MVGKRHVQPVEVLDDVVVREDVAILRHDEPGAARFGGLLAGITELLEEILEAGRNVAPRRALNALLRVALGLDQTTTAGVTCSAIETNALLASAIGLTS
jgi:hypothetical protein